MKFIHLGDLHFGKKLIDFDLTDDQNYLIDKLISFIREKKIESVLISGDIYDRAIPSESATNLFDEFLSELAGLGVNTFIISGNHDSDERLNFASSLLKTNKIFISSVYDGSLHKEVVTDEYGEINVYMLPFVKKSQVERYYPDVEINSYEDAVRTVIEHADIDITKRNIILAHQFVIGANTENEINIEDTALDPELSGSESFLTIGNVQKVSYKVFDIFDYVALGHIHRPQKVGRDTVRYAGSPLKYSLSECVGQKSVPVVSIGSKGDINTDLVYIKPLRDLRHIKGPLSDIIAPENIVDTDDYIYVTLTNEETIPDAINIIRQYYPRVVHLDYDNKKTRALQDAKINDAAQEMSYNDLVKEFYKSMYGNEITEEELNLMLEVGREAGVTDETN